jgi:hypothetical protein
VLRRTAWTGRGTALAGSVVALLAVATSAWAWSQGERLETVRVCGANVLDKKAGECTRDQSGSALSSSAFHCSAKARSDSGERFAGRFMHRGQAFPAYGTNIGKDQRGVYIYLTAGPYPMPGGPWGCELRVGDEVVRKSFRSGGPTGPIVHMRACRTSRTVSAGPVKVCSRDESATTFSATQPVVCSAVLVGGKGKRATIEFVYEGKKALSADFTLPLPVTAAGPRLEPSPRLASGRWGCRWSVAGRVLATKSFRIG